MNQGIQSVNTASKDILARLLASEDLTVRHDAGAETAYFDTQNRVLCLPVWQDMDNFMYDMLVGHEVAHALFTPADDWKGFVGSDAESGLKQMCLNVCEDARIERKIKDKFPGLRRDFAKAYQTLHDRDIFQVKNKTVGNLPLLDRINLYYKGEIYGQMTVPFSADERIWLNRLDSANSFEDIMEISKDLYDATREEQEEQENEESSGVASDSDTSDSQGVGDGDGGSDSETGESNDNVDSSASSSGSEDSEDGEDGDTTNGSSEQNSDNGDSDESTTTADLPDKNSDLSYDEYGTGHMPGETQQNYEQARSALRDSEAGEYRYYDVPKADLSKVIIPSSEISKLWDEWWSGSRASHYTEERNIADTLRTEFYNNSKAIVNHMVQQFQQKQAADAAKRSYTSKTGVLDPVSMINYRWSEDIFLKNEMHSDGQSHGIVMFLDWSGSMSHILQDTVEQLMILVEFCRKAGIPYDVHAFTSNPFVKGLHSDSHERHKAEEEAYKKCENQFLTGENTLTPHSFQLLNFLSSKQNAKQHSQAIRNLYYLAVNNAYRSPGSLGLGSTPLNEAIVAALEIIPEFQNAHGVQIVNTVFLTDGDGHEIVRYRPTSQEYWGKDNKVFITDPVTRKSYACSAMGRGNTSALLNILRDRTKSSTIGIRLHPSNSIKGLQYRYFHTSENWEQNNKDFQEACTSYRKEHHFACENDGYDLHLVVKGNLKIETDPLEKLDDGATNAKIRNAFIKGGTRKKSSRVIANRIVDIVACA